MNALIIFLKYPQAGHVKTRLGAQIGNHHAAELYRIFVRYSLETALNFSDCKVYAAFSPPEQTAGISTLVPNGIECFPQRGRDLGEKMLAAFQHAFAAGPRRVAIIGTDSPTLPAEYLRQAFRSLATSDLVLGPAEDGGYYLIGTKRPQPQLLQNMLWSASTVLENTLARARKLRLKYGILPPWYDVDDCTTLLRAAEEDRRGSIRAYLEQHPEILASNK